MQCPACERDATRVIDSRPAAKGREIRRRRQCEAPGCAHRFTTKEKIEAKTPKVRKKRDGKTQLFDSKKLLRSLEIATGASDAELLSQLESFVEHLERELSTRTEYVETTELGRKALDFLHGLDPVAYIRYASVYDKFSTIDEFIEVLRPFQTDDGAEQA